jgi:23S rRNA (guanosine2251-2'-O)-methyltransferase
MKPGTNIIYGTRPVIEAIKSGKEIEKILIQNGLRSEAFYELKGLIKELDLPFQYVPLEKLSKITYKNHQGIVAYISSISYHDIGNIIATAFEEGNAPLVLVLDRITDVRNFGAIARTAECAGVNALIIPSRGAAQINPDAIKTSAGALNSIPVCRSNNMKETLKYLRQSGLKIVSCTEKAEKIYSEADYNAPLAVIMGSEENGISNEYLDFSDLQVRIPVIGSIDSLNVSVATGIMLYEILRQRIAD